MSAFFTLIFEKIFFKSGITYKSILKNVAPFVKLLSLYDLKK